MSAFILVTRRHGAPLAVATVTACAAIAWVARPARAPGSSSAPSSSAPAAPSSAAPAARAIHVDDPPAPVALPAWATDPARPARRIAGHVVDIAGAPLAARVYLRLDDAPQLWRGIDVATDARGRFDLGIWPAGSYRVIAMAPGLGSRPVDVRTDGGTGNDVDDGKDVELIAEACEPVRGVVTSGGVPVVGARVAHAGITLAHSDAGGHFALCVTEPSLDVRAPGLAPAWPIDPFAAPGLETRVELWPTVRLAARVVDGHGRPRAQVLIQPAFDDPGSHELQRASTAATTDADGVFAIDLPDRRAAIAGTSDLPRRYEVWATLPSGRFDAVWFLEDPMPIAPVALHLLDENLTEPEPQTFVAHVRGRVVRDGRPVADAFVDLVHPPGTHERHTHTRADGTFTLDLDADQLGVSVIEASDDDGRVGTGRVQVRAGRRNDVGAITLASEEEDERP